MSDFKAIHDAVHGTIRIEGVILDLMETLEIQRLSSIRQLGLTYLVFPGANHSRVEHCLGVGHVAGVMADALRLPPDERRLVTAAGLLHDVGHGPFSHTLEHVLSSELAVDHMHLTQRILLGEEDNVAAAERKALPDVPRIPEVLEAHDVKPKDVAALIRGLEGTPDPGLTLGRRGPAKRYLHQIIHSAVDADQIDYLMRDAHYTGVALGVIDFSRIAGTLVLRNGQVAIDRKGLPAIEGMLVARALMYSSVYFHKTVRIAEQMVARAVERSKAPMSDVQKMVDHELMAWLLKQGGFPRDVGLRVKYRRLYKRAWEASRKELAEAPDAVRADLGDRARRRRVEDGLARRVGANPGEVIVDLPGPELLLSEPRIERTDLLVVDDGTPVRLRKLTPLGRALQLREVSDWAVLVSCPPQHRKAVARAANRWFSG